MSLGKRKLQQSLTQQQQLHMYYFIGAMKQASAVFVKGSHADSDIHCPGIQLMVYVTGTYVPRTVYTCQPAAGLVGISSSRVWQPLFL